MSAEEIALETEKTRVRNMMQKAVIQSPFNMWVTGEEVKHPPTLHEAAEHWARNGGPEKFAEEHPLDAPLST